MADLGDARLYLCTDSRRGRGDLSQFLDAVLDAGVDVVQLREKNLEAGEEIELCEIFQTACTKHGKLFSVNDRADVAFAVQPDILHLGQDDLPVDVAREILGRDVRLGLSSHARHEFDAAIVDDDVDYVCAGPVWPTPTKPGRPAPGLPLVEYAAKTSTTKPWFAIGGIDLGNLDQVLAAGATRVVVVRAITEASDPAAATRELTRRLRAT